MFDVRDFGALGDEAHDDTPAIQAAIDAAVAAGGGEIFIAKGTYLISPQTQVQAGQDGASCLNITGSNIRIFGTGPGNTVLKAQTYGNKSPVTDWEIWAPVSTPMLRSQAYSTNNRAYINGHTYRATNSGTTSASTASEPSGIFTGTVTDGTVQWEVADLPWRGHGVFIGNNCKNVTIEMLTLDGQLPRDDSTYPLNSINASPPVMHGSYDDVTYALNVDASHKGICVNGSNVDELRLLRLELKNWHGEPLYGSAHPIYNVYVDDCDVGFSYGSGLSITCDLYVRNSRFLHIGNGIETFNHEHEMIVRDCQFSDCYQGILQGAQGASPVASPGSFLCHGNIFRDCYARGVFVIGFVRNVEICGNDFYDCGQNSMSDVESIRISSFYDGSPNNVFVHHNRIYVDKVECYRGLYLTGALKNVRVEDNEVGIYTDNAVSTTKRLTFSLGFALNSDVSGSPSKVFFRRNRFRDLGGISPSGMDEYNEYHGKWEDNTYQTGLNYDGQFIANGGTIYPHNERVYVGTGTTIQFTLHCLWKTTTSSRMDRSASLSRMGRPHSIALCQHPPLVLLFRRFD